MVKFQGDKAAKFVAWLSCVKGFLPNSMSLSEASEIFERRFNEQQDLKKNEKKESTN